MIYRTRYRRAGAQTDRLGKSFPTVCGTVLRIGRLWFAALGLGKDLFCGLQLGSQDLSISLPEGHKPSLSLVGPLRPHAAALPPASSFTVEYNSPRSSTPTRCYFWQHIFFCDNSVAWPQLGYAAVGEPRLPV